MSRTRALTATAALMLLPALTFVGCRAGEETPRAAAAPTLSQEANRPPVGTNWTTDAPPAVTGAAGVAPADDGTAARERALAEREAAVAQREAEVAHREASASPAPAVIASRVAAESRGPGTARTSAKTPTSRSAAATSAGPAIPRDRLPPPGLSRATASMRAA